MINCICKYCLKYVRANWCTHRHIEVIHDMFHLMSKRLQFKFLAAGHSTCAVRANGTQTDWDFQFYRKMVPFESSRKVGPLKSLLWRFQW